MKTKIIQFIEYILSSFDNYNKGASGKKLSAFAITCAYCYAHKYVDGNNIAVVLGVDAGLITALFSVNVVEKIKVPQENGQSNS